MRRKKTGTKRTLADVATDWARASEAEKQECAQAAAEARRGPAEVAACKQPDVAQRLWPYSGDDFYPIRLDQLGDLP